MAEMKSPKPDLLRSIATLATAMDVHRDVYIWVPASGFIFQGYFGISGKVIRMRPEEGSGRNWLVTLDVPGSPVKEYFLKLDEWPQVQFAI